MTDLKDNEELMQWIEKLQRQIAAATASLINYKVAVENVVDDQTRLRIDEELNEIQKGERRIEVARMVEKLRKV